MVLGRLGDLEAHLLGSQLVANAGQHEVDDLADLVRVSERKTIVASIRLRNSGRKAVFSSVWTFSRMSS